MLINVLIRTSYRPALFRRCLASVRKQRHKAVRIIVAYDDDRALEYIPDDVDRVKVTPDRSKPYFWNLYCNTLKDQVREGWFFFLDDDDVIINDEALAKMNAHLTDDPAGGIICQFLRWGKAKPNDTLMEGRKIIRGLIGMPCIFLHHSQKDLAEFDGRPAADFRFIRAVSERLPLTFIKLIIVKTDRIGKGKRSHTHAVQPV